MRNNIIITMLVLTLLMNFSAVYAVSSNSTGTTSSSASFDTTALNATVNNAIGKINNAFTKVSALPLNTSTKQTILNNLTNTKAKFTDYQTRIQALTTNTDFQALNSEILKFIHDNKDIIKNSYTDSLISLGNDTTTSISSYISKVTLVNTIFKAKCPTQKTQLDKIDKDMKNLTTLFTKLNTDLKAKNAASIKQDLKDSSTSSKAVYDDLVIMSMQCK